MRFLKVLTAAELSGHESMLKPSARQVKGQLGSGRAHQRSVTPGRKSCNSQQWIACNRHNQSPPDSPSRVADVEALQVYCETHPLSANLNLATPDSKLTEAEEDK